MAGTNLLTERERLICEVYGLVLHIRERYSFYQEHVEEVYKDLFDAAEKLPGDKRIKAFRNLAGLVGECANLDRDFQIKLRNDNAIRDNVVKCKELLGMLAVEKGRTE